MSLTAHGYTLDEYSQDVGSLKGGDKELFFSSAQKFKCPTCVGLSVLGSDATFSMQIRKKLIELVKEKKDEEEIKSFFVERYGLWLLRTPPKEGVHLFLWLIPIVMLLGIACFVAYFVYRSKQLSNQSDEKSDELFNRDLEYYRGL